MNYKKLEEINKRLKTIDIKGKDYIEVNQRILAFQEMFENGSITTDIIKMEDGIVTIKATISVDDKIVATGHAQEKESGSFINKTSYIENCETSAVGRALGMLGIGATNSIASAEEVLNAIKNQNKTEIEEININAKVGFGKYKDNTWLEIYNENKSYYDYLIENAKSEDGAETYKKIREEIEKSFINIEEENENGTII